MSLHKQALWSVLPLATVTALNLVSVPLFYRFLGADNYAIWLYVLTLSGAFGFMDLGLGVSVGRYIGIALGRGDRAAVEAYWATGNAIALPLLALMGTGFGLAGVWFGTSWFNVAESDQVMLRWCFVVAGFNLFLGFYGQFWMILAQAFLDFKFLSIVRTIFSLVQIVPALALAQWTGSPLILVCWSTLTGLLYLLLLIFHGHRAYNLRVSLAAVSRSRAVEMAAYTGKVFLTLLCASIGGTIDRLLLGKFVSPREFTFYSIAANAGARVQGISQALMGPVFHNTNRVATGDQTAAVRSIYTQAFDLLFSICLTGVLLAVFWDDVILRFWLGVDLATSVQPVFIPLIIAFAFQALSSISSAQLGSLDRQEMVLLFQIVTITLTAAGIWLGWQLAGLPGAAYGFALSRVVGIVQDVTLSTIIRGGGWFSRSVWLTALGLAGISIVCAFLNYALVHADLRIDLMFLILNAAAGLVFVWLRARSIRAIVLP